jgi:hypothetical protein
MGWVMRGVASDIVGCRCCEVVERCGLDNVSEHKGNASQWKTR